MIRVTPLNTSFPEGNVGFNQCVPTSIRDTNFTAIGYADIHLDIRADTFNYISS